MAKQQATKQSEFFLDGFFASCPDALPDTWHFSVRSIATILARSDSCIRYWIKKHGLMAAKSSERPGGRLLIRVRGADLKSWLKENRPAYCYRTQRSNSEKNCT